MKTILGFLLAAATAAAASLWFWSTDWEDKPRFRHLAVERGELLIAISATGTVEPEEVIDVGAQIIGRIKQFGPDLEKPGKTIDFGSHVKADAVLGQLDDSPYLAELDKARANLKVIQADLQRTRAQLTEAKNNFERAQVLRDTNSESDYDRAVAQHEMAKSEVAVGEARVEQAEIVKKQAEINLGFTTIKAPIDGVVIDRRVNVGQTVVAGLNAPSLFLLARDLSRMQVWAAVNEADIGDIRLGQKVTFKVDAHRNRTFVGSVSQIRLNAGMSNNVVTYGVVVAIENTDGALLPYMTANLQFEVARRTNALLVPNQALRWRPTLAQITPAARAAFAPRETVKDRSDEEPIETDKPLIWLTANDGLVRPAEVGLGLSDGIVTEVTGDGVALTATVVVGTMRKAKRDFVSSFVSRVTSRGKEE